ncbi:GNAT family N-acetyltransferase [Wohlfahrtiimonas chitiniclastica]|uniref:GNAT family N-acetyltransferase n=1 Tax=Wohlfahrtiimonas chitiniclastica TaxID=400946 RepID=UPI003A4C5C29
MIALQIDVPNIHRRKSAGSALCAKIVTRDDARITAILIKLNHRKMLFGQQLIARCTHFILRRQIHPQLYHIKHTT